MRDFRAFRYLLTARLKRNRGCCRIDAALLALQQLKPTLVVVFRPGLAGLEQSLALLRGQIPPRYADEATVITDAANKADRAKEAVEMRMDQALKVDSL